MANYQVVLKIAAVVMWMTTLFFLLFFFCPVFEELSLLNASNVFIPETSFFTNIHSIKLFFFRRHLNRRNRSFVSILRRVELLMR